MKQSIGQGVQALYHLQPVQGCLQLFNEMDMMSIGENLSYRKRAQLAN